MRTAPFALRLACFIATTLALAACEPANLPAPGPRLLDVVGDVRDHTGAPVAVGHVPTAETTYRVPLDAALTLVLANGCVLHARGPAEHAFTSLLKLHTEPCAESVDEQVKLLRGFEGARSTLRERTAAAGLDATTVSDGPSVLSEKKLSKTEVEAADAQGASLADVRLQDAKDQRDDLSSEEVESPDEKTGPVRGREKQPTPPKDDRGDEPPLLQGTPPQETPPQESPPQKRDGAPQSPPPPNAGSPPPVTPPEKCVPSPTVACSAPPPEWRNGPHEAPPLALPKEMALVFVRSRTLEAMLNTRAHKRCVGELGGDGVLHAVVSQGKIVDIRRLDGRQLGCHSLRGLALAMPDGIAVAVIAPVR